MNPWLEERIILFYVVVDEFVKHQRPLPKKTNQMSDSEVLFTALFAAWFCYGNMERARVLLGENRYIPNMLSKSQLNRRLEDLHSLLPALVHLLSLLSLSKEAEPTFVVDTFPIPVCQNIRISRCRIYQEEAFRGYIASKKMYFYGLKLLVLTNEEGLLTQLAFAPGSTSDIKMLQALPLDLPKGSELISDKGFTDYALEDVLAEAAAVKLLPLRKQNAKRQYPVGSQFRLEKVRKRIETVGSQINALFPKKIHAVTAKGFERKIVFFVLAFAMQALFLS